MNVTASVLVAGVGNIFAGDDAFGVEVAQRLAARTLPPGVRAVDFGLRSLDLAYALQDECDAAVLIDAAARGGAPGTLYVIEPEACARPSGPAPFGHGFDPEALLGLLGSPGMRCRRLVIVGCEPDSLGDPFEGAMGLSAPVAAAVEEAVRVVERLAARLGAQAEEAAA